MMFLSSDLISCPGVKLLSISTGRDQGKGVPGKIGLLTGSRNQDQGGQVMQGLSSNPQDLPQESPAKGHALIGCQGCTQGPGQSRSLLLQDQHHHLPQGDRQGIPGAVFCEFFTKILVS